MSAEIHQPDANGRSEDTQYKALMANIRICLNDKLSELLERMLNSADDTLFQLAETATSNEDQVQYFDTMRVLRTERKNISRQFAAALRSYLQPEIDDASAEPQDDELSLVDQDEMEELVAISAMHGDSINHLQARLEVLSMKIADAPDRQALIPRHICEAFQQALSQVDLSTRNKLMVYKLFDQEVCSQLDDLYQALNKLLIDENILPQIKLDKPASRQSESGRSPEQPQASVDDLPVTTGAVQGQNFTHMEISRVACQFINGEAIAQGPGIPASFSAGAMETAGNSNHYYDRRDVLRALSNLQANFIQHNEVTEFVDAETFKRALMIDMGSRHGGTLTRRVNQIDEKTIDFIEMLFEVILEDSSISEPVTNLLLRLQIPVIKIAMLDQQLFSSSEHPARQVLNLIARVGRGIDERTDEIYGRLEHIIDHLLEEFDVDIISFQLAVDQLNKLIQGEQRITEENEKHTRKQVLQQHARQTVLTELQHLMASRILPKAVYPLVLKHWSTLMFHRYIRHGKASEEWNQAVSLLKQLLNSLQTIGGKSQWSQLSASRFTLITNIKEALYDTHQDKVNIDQALDALATTYEQMLEHSVFGPDDSDTFDALPDVEVEPMTVSPLEQQQKQAREKIARLPGEVRPGAWFLVFDGPERPRRHLKLSVILMAEAKLIFVDRLGIKVLEKDAATFAEDLQSGRSAAIAEHPLFDHALDQVIGNLSAAS